MYLQDNAAHRGVVNAGALPVRAVAGVPGDSIPHGGDNNAFRNYAVFIRGAAYNAAQLNNFVVEICAKINQQRDLNKIQT